jgi:outer membrane protein OmpA-like peptidoglycan-associated protein
MKTTRLFPKLLTLVALTVVLSSCASNKVDPATIDTDGDGLTDVNETNIHNTDPLNPDTDGDGLTDGQEVNEFNTDPLSADTDEDGLSDGEEVNSYNTDPLAADSDGDGLSDGAEVNDHNTDPLNADSDGDGLTDGQEVTQYNTNPLSPDTDGDEYGDADEIANGTDPNDASDPGRVRDMSTVTFGFDRSDISDVAAQALANNVEKLLAAPAVDVQVDAYTDHVGGDQYNLRLSLRRANAVVDFYRSNGVSEDRIESRGLGKAPVPCMESEKDADTPGCEKNRRAESSPVHPF